jgi:U3 small nucleolar ribonucleoprotein component
MEELIPSKLIEEEPVIRGSHFSSEDSKINEGEDSNDGRYKKGRWNMDEHIRFLEALKLYGKEWKLVQKHVTTRSST